MQEQANPKHTNRLINETSPYLRQHAHNPVDWYAWGEEALAEARDKDKPIFLSIGYSACHWCHVMERESFEQEATAALMNELFVNIKVDREERPDLDSIYMDAVQAMTGQGGWPMSVFLTPAGKPFYGGTYFPPLPRYGMPGFVQVLRSVDEAYRQRRDQVEGQAERLTTMLRRSVQFESQAVDLGVETLDQAVKQLLQHFDDQNGGFGSQPKFPQPMTLEFILSQYLRTGDLDTLYMAELTLEQMALGGLYDQLGGGFHRYSVDADRLVPHFEKMLYDNAQLLLIYLHAWQLNGGALYERVVHETTDYVLREMTAPTGGFYATQDADSEGEEGKFFVWTPAELESVLGANAAKIFAASYGVTTRGNFEGKNILHVRLPIESVAQEFRLSAHEIEQSLTSSRKKLFDEREKRVKPARDEKILVEWNGLMIHALAEVGVALGRPDALDAAIAAANFVLTEMSQPDGKLYRSYKDVPGFSAIGAENPGKDKRARLNAYLEDYAAFARALVALYEATFDLRWLGEASRLTRMIFEQFHDGEKGGFFQTGIDHETLVTRRKDYIDNAVPSGNSLTAELLLRLAVLVDSDTYRREATRVLLTLKDAMAQQPTGFGRMLSALHALLQPSQEVAIVGDPAEGATRALLAEVRQRYLPTTVLALRQPEAETVLPLLLDRGLVNGQPAAYVCENYACQLPVTTPEALAALLDH